MGVHLTIEPLRVAPSAFWASYDSLRVGNHARLVMGNLIVSSLMSYSLSPSIVLMIYRDPSEKLTAARLASWFNLSENASLSESFCR